MVETYNSRVDQIPRAPPILKGLDSKKFVQKPFPPRATPKTIPKKFCIPEIPKYNGTTDSNEHVTSYTCAIKGKDLEGDEIESVLLKKFGETLSKGAMIWYYNLPPNFIDSFAMIADSFVKAHAGAIKADTRKSDLFKVKHRYNEILRELVSRFQMGSVSAYNGERRGSGSGQNPVKSERRSDRGQNNQGLMSKTSFDRPIGPKEAPSISDTKWPQPLQFDPAQRGLNLMGKYHGTRGHMTEDCRQLREEVAQLFNNVHLREFLSDRAKNHFRNRYSGKQVEPEEPQHVINIIIGGVDIPKGPMLKRTKVSITRGKRTWDYVPEGTLSFNDVDAEGIIQPHNDALVISVLINKS
ncbi:uncharacterized protein [Nicotiana tomentosiformis]|uniref:uncharacterized protein n=1 Tax=Nicotiana tomentosiformis TaxID=4098 RepID=UPI00388CD190